jgi:hypothetical protein
MIVVIIIALMSSANSYGALQWSAPGTIKNVRVSNGSLIYGDVEGVTLTCGSSSFRLASGLRLENGILSILLTAQSTGKKIKFHHEPGSCENTYTTIIRGAWIEE